MHAGVNLRGVLVYPPARREPTGKVATRHRAIEQPIGAGTIEEPHPFTEETNA